MGRPDYVETIIEAVRRQVESGTIKGEVVEWCEAHKSSVSPNRQAYVHCDFYQLFYSGPVVMDFEWGDCHIVSKLLIPVSDGGSET